MVEADIEAEVEVQRVGHHTIIKDHQIMIMDQEEDKMDMKVVKHKAVCMGEATMIGKITIMAVEDIIIIKVVGMKEDKITIEITIMIKEVIDHEAEHALNVKKKDIWQENAQMKLKMAVIEEVEDHQEMDQ